MPKPVFMYTEFTSFDHPEFVAIALVCGKREFCMEVSNSHVASCSSLAIDHSIGYLPPKKHRKAVSKVVKELRNWLDALRADSFLVSDSPGFDAPFLGLLLSAQWPARIQSKIVTFPISGPWSEDRRQRKGMQTAVEAAYLSALLRHGRPHPLNRARALEAAWEAATARGWKPRPDIRGLRVRRHPKATTP